MDLRWRPGICLVLWSKKLFSLLPGHSYANADTRHSTLTIRVGGCPTHFLIPSMCQRKRNEDPPWYARSHMAIHMARIVEGGLLARLGVWNLLSKSFPATVDCHFSQSYCPIGIQLVQLSQEYSVAPSDRFIPPAPSRRATNRIKVSNQS
jgi:hypothetical protein